MIEFTNVKHEQVVALQFFSLYVCPWLFVCCSRKINCVYCVFYWTSIQSFIPSFSLSGKAWETFSFSGVMRFLSNCCHIFHRLGAGAGRVAAGVPGCGGGAEGPFSEQKPCVPAHPARGQKPHWAGGRQWSGGLRLQWVTRLSSRSPDWDDVCLLFRLWGRKCIMADHLLVGDVVWSRHECSQSPFISLNNCSLTLLIYVELVVQEATSLHSLFMTILSVCTGMNCNYGEPVFCNWT